MQTNKRTTWKDILYWIFRSYLQFFHDKVYYRRIYREGTENIPAVGTPLLIVSNHQNSINDPLAIELEIGPRIVSIFARVDVFGRPILNTFLRSLYILPAYRLQQDGEHLLGKNYAEFEEADNRLLAGGTVAIFPEGVNQDKHWLGEFSLGYLRMAFGAAEKSGFQKEIFVLPTCNHYSNYFNMQSDMVLCFGKPVSLKPYYELYKTKPRTAQREVNKLVRERVSALMLNIEDVDNYEAIDYIRETYGRKYARRLGLNAKRLPEKLQADKKLCALLDAQKENADATGVTELYRKVLELKQKTRALGFRDWNFDKPFRYGSVVGRAIAAIVLFPLFVFALIPNLILYWAPRRLVRLFKEKGGSFVMFTGGIQYILTSLITAPVCYSVVFVLDWCLLNWWLALIHLCAQPWLGVFAWHYRLQFIKWKSELRFHRLGKYGKVDELYALRKEIWTALNVLLNV